MNPIHTIGHSNHPIAHFIALLQGAAIDLLIDVRSIPASRRWPQFDRAALAAGLAAAQVDYLWLGESLGGRPRGRSDAAPDYEEIARGAAFAAAIERVLRRATARHPALMCAERDPLDCHRTALVGRHLAVRGAELRHILADGRIAAHAAIEEIVLQRSGLGSDDLLAGAAPRAERLAQAWRAHGRAMTGRR